MQYRRLTLDEFEKLESQFIQFLAVNSVTGADWEKFKANNHKRMNQLLDEFSDVVLGSVIERAEYLVHAQAKELVVFHFNESELIIIGLSTNVHANFHQWEKLSDAIFALPDDAKLETFTFSKGFEQQARNVEVFKLLESGAQIANQDIFEQIKKLHLAKIY